MRPAPLHVAIARRQGYQAALSLATTITSSPRQPAPEPSSIPPAEPSQRLHPPPRTSPHRTSPRAVHARLRQRHRLAHHHRLARHIVLHAPWAR